MQKFQKELLADLYHLREAFLSDIKSLGTVTLNVDGIPEDPKDKKIAELEAENRRLQYRIHHLTRNLKQRLG